MLIETKSLQSENSLLSQQVNVLKEENCGVKEELEKYKPIVEKFTYSSEKLNMILNNQRAVFNKVGLGYKPNQK